MYERTLVGRDGPVTVRVDRDAVGRWAFAVMVDGKTVKTGFGHTERNALTRGESVARFPN